MSTNEERRATTRAALLAAARDLFVDRGFEGTSTPEVVARAGVTRGALYHHFADKRDLFRAVIEHEHRAVANAVDGSRDLRSGIDVYLEAMAVPGRTRLLLIDAPAVLGAETAEGLDGSSIALREGLDAARPTDDNAVLAALLSATFDRAALEVAKGADARQVHSALLTIIDRVVADSA